MVTRHLDSKFIILQQFHDHESRYCQQPPNWDSPNFYRRIASEMWRETLKFPYPGKWREREEITTATEALRFSWRVSIVMLSKCEIYCKWKARVFTVTAARTIRGYLKILSIHDSRAIEIKFTLGWFSAGGNCAKRQLEGPVRFITFNLRFASGIVIHIRRGAVSKYLAIRDARISLLLRYSLLKCCPFRKVDTFRIVVWMKII